MDGRTGLRLRIREVDALFRHAPMAWRSLIQNTDLFTALLRGSPNAENAAAFSIVDKLAVRRIKGFHSTVSCHLHSLASFSRRLPYLPISAAVRTEVDPLPIARPARPHIVGSFRSDAARSA